MTLPYTFVNGTLANATEVNANFTYVDDMIAKSVISGVSISYNPATYTWTNGSSLTAATDGNLDTFWEGSMIMGGAGTGSIVISLPRTMWLNGLYANFSYTCDDGNSDLVTTIKDISGTTHDIFRVDNSTSGTIISGATISSTGWVGLVSQIQLNIAVAGAAEATIRIKEVEAYK